MDLRARRAIVSETVSDIETTFEEVAADNQLTESMGVGLGPNRAIESNEVE